MASFSISQLIIDAQKMANRVKDLDNLSGLILVEAEGNNKLVENLRLFQEDLDILNRLANHKTNSEIVNRIQQQNACSSEIIKENRELKVCLEDYEKALELIMKKYREHTSNNILEAKINFKDGYNEGLWRIINQQREKINEMATVMKHAASLDDEAVQNELETISKLQLENKTLRELLVISTQFGSMRNMTPAQIEKGVQTDTVDQLPLDQNENTNTGLSNIELPNMEESQEN